MNKTTLKNIAQDELRLLIKKETSTLSNLTVSELKAAAESEDKILAKTVARQIQPKIQEMQNANGIKKAFLILKYYLFRSKSGECTIPEEALRSFVRTIMPDIIAFFESEEGNREYEEWLKEQEAKEKASMLMYHYCAFNKFESILTSKTLWLTQFVNSNDAEEINRTLKIIWDKIKNDVEKGIKDLPNHKAIMDSLNKQIETDLIMSIEGDETPYGVCLSQNRDLAQNWNEYGDMSRGVALGFSEELLAGISYELPHPNADINRALGWNPVYYDENGLSNEFTKIFIKEIHSNPVLGWLNVRKTLKCYSAFIKNPTFKDEKEVRIVFYPNDIVQGKSDSEISGLDKNKIPHCSLPWLKSSGACALKEIIIGTNCEYTKEDIIKMLAKNGIKSEINIVKSEYPYRISKNR